MGFQTDRKIGPGSGELLQKTHRHGRNMGVPGFNSEGDISHFLFFRRWEQTHCHAWIFKEDAKDGSPGDQSSRKV